jgi:hypothetical protein
VLCSCQRRIVGPLAVWWQRVQGRNMHVQPAMPPCAHACCTPSAAGNKAPCFRSHQLQQRIRSTDPMHRTVHQQYDQLKLDGVVLVTVGAHSLVGWLSLKCYSQWQGGVTGSSAAPMAPSHWVHHHHHHVTQSSHSINAIASSSHWVVMLQRCS